MKSISYILGGYNEEENVYKAVDKVYNNLKQFTDDFEIILIDDGSKDNTVKKMEEAKKIDENRIKILQNYVNLNFGTTILRGLKFATKEYIIYNAFDLPLKPSDTEEIISEMENKNYDVLVLERVGYNPSKWRKITSNINGLLLHILYPVRIKGTPILNFVQVFKKEIISDIMPLSRSPIFVWPEMVFRAKKRNLNVGNKKIQIDENQTRKGSFGKPHDIMWGIYDMLRYKIHSKK